MIDPSGVVRIIPTPTPLPCDPPSTFRIHAFRRLLRGEDPGVNSAMKSAKICPLIDVLDSKGTLKHLISVTHIAILPLASGFSTMVLSGYSVSTTMRKD